ncbi:hypothetical protein CRG98_024676, partial [Punica granatum]
MPGGLSGNPPGAWASVRSLATGRGTGLGHGARSLVRITGHGGGAQVTGPCRAAAGVWSRSPVTGRDPGSVGMVTGHRARYGARSPVTGYGPRPLCTVTGQRTRSWGTVPGIVLGDRSPVPGHRARSRGTGHWGTGALGTASGHRARERERARSQDAVTGHDHRVRSLVSVGDHDHPVRSRGTITGLGHGARSL